MHESRCSRHVRICPTRTLAWLRFERQLFEAEYLADEDSVFVPADVSAIVHPQENLRARELRQFTWQSDGAGVVETRWDLVVQALMRALVIEHVAKAIEAALLCAKRCRRRFSSCAPSACDASAHGDRFVGADLLECAHAQSDAHLYSPGTNLDRSELAQLENATRSVDVAVYSFTDLKLAQELVRPRPQGCASAGVPGSGAVPAGVGSGRRDYDGSAASRGCGGANQRWPGSHAPEKLRD